MSTPHENIWTDNASYLQPAFLEAVDGQIARLIVFGLEQHLPDRPCRVVDIGGGEGSQAILLAQHGHSVTLVDLDPTMLQAASDRLSSLSPEVRQRVTLVQGTAASMAEAEPFDVVCCHSVLMYEKDWHATLGRLVRLAGVGGIVSITSVNPEARAMRLGRQRRWREVIATIATGRNGDPGCIPCTDITRAELHQELAARGVAPIAWYGVGVFEDGSSEESFAAEWLAGATDPYRSVARCFHIVGQRQAQ